ncbi:hypothetical protein [Solicola gregarius]|uniref:Uncharacterized protein n=1 Tax=Solicola gregarius TaxID=2908642 RepID=A0AA46TN11_9ACTN|nr:hypothetical protein [Solicola gregarius]UYM07952.1 hypothetical protein L0C25_00850 [Solicola gregarius]
MSGAHHPVAVGGELVAQPFLRLRPRQPADVNSGDRDASSDAITGHDVSHEVQAAKHHDQTDDKAHI